MCISMGEDYGVNLDHFCNDWAWWFRYNFSFFESFHNDNGG
jgi:hypothetical protein